MSASTGKWVRHKIRNVRFTRFKSGNCFYVGEIRHNGKTELVASQTPYTTMTWFTVGKEQIA